MRSHSAALLLLLTVLLGALPTAPARAWGNLEAHPAINRRALAKFEATYARTPKYDRAPLDHSLLLHGMGVVVPGKLTVRDEPLTLDVTGWIEHGGFSADEPEAYAALRHFYDPLGLNGGAHYLTDQVPVSSFPNPQIDALSWAIKHPENPYSWQRALQFYKLALESPRDREANLAYALRSLGETMHLLADMTQPAHVRNDSHLANEPIEDAVTATIVISNAATPLDSRFTLQTTSPSDLFERVARYTNFNFYSSDTIYNPADPAALPRNGEANYDSPSFDSLTFNEADYTYYADFDVGQVPMVQWTYSAYMLGLLAAPGARGFHVPAAFADRQAAVLIPLAIHANMLLLDLYFPTLDLVLTPALRDDGQMQYGGELRHQLERDAAWQPEQDGPGAIRYNGPGQLRVQHGRETRTLVDLQFELGRVREPVVLDQRAMKLQADDQLFLEIQAGGRVFRSAPLRLEGPQISALEPAEGVAGTVVTIRGRTFGAEQGRSTVTFAGSTASVRAWSDTTLVAVAPNGVRDGAVVVTVQGFASNGVRFSVAGQTTTPPTPEDGPTTAGASTSAPRLCFAVEPLDPTLPPPWVAPQLIPMPSGDEETRNGWACVSDSRMTLNAGDVPVHTNCAPPEDRLIIRYVLDVAYDDSTSSFSNADGSIHGTYTPNGITMIVQYPDTSSSTNVCPGGEAVVVFKY